ncbi:MAG: hypothetical protein E7675_03215 [Ruminococcaceae bacterium]|nr:hypothetical protein [Oscillospiraceae bacterium]
MTIDRIYIKSFGNLQNFEFKPHACMNIINGENESGKSTLAAFIKFIFYGFPSKKSKDQPIGTADRYINWDTHLASGSVELTLNDGTPYRIEREVFRSGKRNSGNVTVINLNSGEALKSPPEDLFLGGISEEVFNRTLFIDQAVGSFVDSGSVYTSIENMLSGADEEVNTKKALSKLDSAKTYLLYKNEKGGKIYSLKKQLDALCDQKSAASKQRTVILDLKEQIKRDTAELTETKDLVKKADTSIASLEGAERLERIQGTIATKKAIEEMESQRSKYIKDATKNGFFPKKEYLSRLNDGIGSYYSTLEKIKDLTKARDQLKISYDDHRQNASLNNMPIEPIVKAISSEDKKRLKLKKLSDFSLIAIGFFVIFFIISAIALPSLRLASGALGVVALLFFIAFKLLIGSSENTIRSLLSGIGVESIEELKKHKDTSERSSEKRELLAKQIGETEGLIKEHDEKLKRILADYTYLSEKYGVSCSTVSHMETFRNSIKDIIEELDRLDVAITRKKEDHRLNAEDFTEEEYLALLSMDMPQIPENRSIRSMLIDAKAEKRSLEKRAEALSSALTQKKVKLTSMLSGFEDEEALKKRIAELDSKIQKLQYIYSALCLAYDSLEKAGTASRNRIAPRLSSLASDFIAEATGGKYDCINVDSRLELSYTHEESTRNIAHLSEGTKDIVYLAFRISLISTLFKDKPPVIIDEGFAGMDDERLQSTLGAMMSHAKKEGAQLFIFSPTSREAQFASCLGAGVFTMPPRD